MDVFVDESKHESLLERSEMSTSLQASTKEQCKQIWLCDHDWRNTVLCTYDDAFDISQAVRNEYS